MLVMGVPEARPRRGTIVISNVLDKFAGGIEKSVTTWASRDLYEVRKLIEGEAAARAALLIDDEQVEHLRHLCGAIERCAAAGKSYFSENERFHLAIAAASRNAILVATLRTIIGVLREYREQWLTNHPEVVAADLRAHKDILDAVCSHQSDRARQLMHEHLDYAAAMVAV